MILPELAREESGCLHSTYVTDIRCPQLHLILKISDMVNVQIILRLNRRRCHKAYMLQSVDLTSELFLLYASCGMQLTCLWYLARIHELLHENCVLTPGEFSRDFCALLAPRKCSWAATPLLQTYASATGPGVACTR